jgi:hypothetical protein
LEDTKINPIDASGSPTKKRGVVIRSVAQLGLIRDILTNPKTAAGKDGQNKSSEKRSYFVIGW